MIVRNGSMLPFYKIIKKYKTSNMVNFSDICSQKE